eukprot:Gb_37887 [translate_table: standard]
MSDTDKGYLREPNPLLKDLQEKKQNFKRMASEVGSMASELRDVRSRMAAQEASFARETACRQAAEAKARNMERELHQLQKSLEEKNCQVQSSTSAAEQVKMPDGRRRIRRTDPLVPGTLSNFFPCAEAIEDHNFRFKQPSNLIVSPNKDSRNLPNTGIHKHFQNP